MTTPTPPGAPSPAPTPTPPNFVIGSTYSFDTYSPTILGSSYQNVVVEAQMTYQMAKSFADVNAIHIQIYPSLPSGTPNDPTTYNYIQIRTTAGNRTVLGIPWINASTVQLVTSQTVTVTVGNVTAADIPIIRAALVQAGYTALNLSISQPVGG